MTPIVTPHYPLGGVSGEFDPRVRSGRRYTLDRDFRVVLPGLDVTVPADFVTDFNSVPRIAWIWFSPWECVEAGVTHDWLYQHPGPLERGDVDDIHRQIMLIQGERGSKARAAWLGIRAGGWKPWNKYRAEESAKAARLPN
jgi:hypothetical protein